MPAWLQRINGNLWRLMQGLLYPAMLGALIVCLMQKLADEHAPDWYRDHQNLLAFAGVLFFCISFCNFNKVDPPNYNIAMFLCDALEIVCIFIMFFALRFLAIDRALAPNMRVFYLAAAIVPILETSWRGFKLGSARGALNYIGIFSLAMSAFLFYMASNGPIFADGLAIAVIYAAIALYAIWIIAVTRQ